MQHNNPKSIEGGDRNAGDANSSEVGAAKETVGNPNNETTFQTTSPDEDDNMELTSNSSHGSASSGGGGKDARDWSGYSADCSSTSDLSSKSSMKMKMDKLMQTLSIEREHQKKVRKQRSSSEEDDYDEDCDEQDDQDDVVIHGNTYGPSAEELRRKQDHAAAATTEASATVGGRQTMLAMSAPFVALNHPLPQFNGVRISHPMDPRIDLSMVHHIRVPLTQAEIDLANTTATAALHQHHHNHHQPEMSMETASLPTNPYFMAGAHITLDQYAQMIEAVRPFFQAYGFPPSPAAGAAMAAATSGGVDKTGDGSINSNVPAESEGYTSFFTTTHTSANNSSDSDKHRSNREDASQSHHSLHQAKTQQEPQPPGENSQKGPVEGVNGSDSSSIIVLARTKRKHLQQEQSGSNPDSSSSSSSGKRVRIQVHHARRDPHDPLHAPLNEHDAAAAGNGDAPDQQLPHVRQDAVVNAPQPEENSSSSDQPERQAPAPGPLHNHNRFSDPPRVVSESSSSAREQNESSNANTTSGSASGGNTGSGSNIGSSGSGQGSSGSGNEGKGSSEELAQDGTGTVGQDGSSNSDTALIEDTHHRIYIKTPPESSLHHGADLSSQLADEDMGAEREKKIQNKKRKRMNMRRAYESKVQQQMESSESGNDHGELILKPGQPVTLDQVLSFSKTARIVIQASPPFLVVHANAAYCRLTGVDTHAAIGKPISSLLSIVDVDKVEESAFQEATTTLLRRSVTEAPQEPVPGRLAAEFRSASDRTAAVAAGRANAASPENDLSDLCLDRLLAASGFGMYHIVQVAGKPHQILGRNVTVVCSADPGGLDNNREDSTSSITSNDCPVNPILCRMGVSPVVSFIDPNLDSAVVTDREVGGHHHRNKRRKNPHMSPAPAIGAQDQQRRGSVASRDQYLQRKNHRHQQITHYVIQLEPATTDNRNLDSIESLSSTSAFVDPSAFAKSELPQPTNDGPDQGENDSDDRDDAESRSTEPKLPVGAIG